MQPANCKPRTGQQGTIYHPEGDFPFNGNQFSLTGLYAFCMMDQTWALPTENRVVIGHLFDDSTGFVECSPGPADPYGVLSLPGCNGVCGGSYPDPTYGVRVPGGEGVLLPNNLSNETAHLAACPGNTDNAMPFTPDGRPDPMGPDGKYPASFGGVESSQYQYRPGAPNSICPACLWYWMTNIAGTKNKPYNPNLDPRMVANGLYRCVEGWDGSSTTPPGYAGPQTAMCLFCPPRSEPYAVGARGNLNGFSDALLAGMLYTDVAIMTFFWFATIRVYFLQGIWLVTYMIICQVHVGSFFG